MLQLKDIISPDVKSGSRPESVGIDYKLVENYKVKKSFMKKKLIALSGFVLSLAPVVALAASVNSGVSCNSGSSVTDIPTLLCKLSQLLNSVVPVLIALAVVYFVWGVVQYVIANDEEAKKTGRMRIIYGIIGLAVIIAMWGLVSILTNTFGLQNSNSSVINLPSVNY